MKSNRRGRSLSMKPLRFRLLPARQQNSQTCAFQPLLHLRGPEGMAGGVGSMSLDDTYLTSVPRRMFAWREQPSFVDRLLWNVQHVRRPLLPREPTQVDLRRTSEKCQ